MRILYHHRTRSRDGQRVHIEGLVGALRRAGHEVLVSGPRPEPVGQARSPRRERARPVRELLEVAYNLVELARLLVAARRARPGALYARHALFCFAPSLMAALCRLPWAAEVNAPLAEERARHGGLFFRGLARWLETRTLNAADRVIVVTAVLGDILVEQGVRRERIEVHWNGVDRQRLDAGAGGAEGRQARRELGVPDAATVLGFVGYVRDWNRLERVYPALERRAELRLVVVGDGPDVPRLQDEARRRGVADRVCFAGEVPEDRIAEHVASFDVALLPEATPYASPLKLLDYLASGRAILAPDRANLREVLQDDGNALLFDPDRDGDFEARLDRLLGDPTLRARLGRAARATIQRRALTWDQNAERVVRGFDRQGGVAAPSAS